MPTGNNAADKRTGIIYAAAIVFEEYTSSVHSDGIRLIDGKAAFDSGYMGIALQHIVSAGDGGVVPTKGFRQVKDIYRFQHERHGRKFCVSVFRQRSRMVL